MIDVMAVIVAVLIFVLFIPLFFSKSCKENNVLFLGVVAMIMTLFFAFEKIRFFKMTDECREIYQELVALKDKPQPPQGDL